MKKKLPRISIGIVLLIVLVSVYTVAVTQISESPKYPQRKIETSTTVDRDTTDIGEPTGDDPWKEFDNLIKAYYVKSGVLCQGTMKLFDGNGEKDKLLEEKRFEFTRFHDEYVYSLEPFEVVNKKNYTVIVNYDDKQIAVVPKKIQRKAGDLFSMADFKKIFQEQKANIKVTQLGNEKILTVDSVQDPQIQGYRIYYSPQTYRINKILIGMARLSPLDDEVNQGDQTKGELPNDADDDDSTGIDEYYYYLEINYLVVNPISIQSGTFNPENKFVKIDGKKIELTPEFKEYELLNSDEQ
jgi:hypothetical protein